MRPLFLGGNDCIQLGLKHRKRREVLLDVNVWVPQLFAFNVIFALLNMYLKLLVCALKKLDFLSVFFLCKLSPFIFSFLNCLTFDLLLMYLSF